MTKTLTLKNVDLEEIKKKIRTKIEQKVDEVKKNVERKVSKAQERAEQKVPPSLKDIYKNLHEKYPKIINIKNPVPFAIGIEKQIVLEDVSKKLLKRWILWYFGKSHYHKNHKTGTIRYNLDGSESGMITEEEEKGAKERVRKIVEKGRVGVKD